MRLLELPNDLSDAAQFGGKAENLSRLRSAGFGIPETWVVDGLGSSPDLPTSPPRGVEATVRSLFARFPALIVRSSAGVEDGGSASFAGQFSSFRVTTVANAWKAIRASVESQTGGAALAYADALQATAGNLRPGVIVQPFVEPRFSGIGFTQGPDTVVVEAVHGHNELLVNGLVTPERFVFRGDDVSRTPGDQQLFAFAHDQIAFPADLLSTSFGAEEAYVIDYDEMAGTVYATHPDLAARTVLSPAQALTLKALLLGARSAFGFDVDVEWVFNRAFTIVQARPVTQLPPDSFSVPHGEEDYTFGQCASPGYVEGPAFVAPERALINNLPAGHILVSQATSPEHTPALLRAAGVITEQGGLLSHTAIVCRELGIPCIVGRRQATREFSSGQRVSLDAERVTITTSHEAQPSKPAPTPRPQGRPVRLVADAKRADGDSLLIGTVPHPDIPTLNPASCELTIAGRTLLCSVEPGNERPDAQAHLVLHDHRAYLEGEGL